MDNQPTTYLQLEGQWAMVFVFCAFAPLLLIGMGFNSLQAFVFGYIGVIGTILGYLLFAGFFTI